MTYHSVAVGGTFDHLHKGHRALLSKSFEVGERVLIGITSDQFAKELGKKLDNNYSIRSTKVESFVRKKFPGRQYSIFALVDYFGKGVFSEDMEALVASRETVQRVEVANKIREERGLRPLKTVVIDTVLADDGKPLSSTRIRKEEVDVDGHLR